MADASLTDPPSAMRYPLPRGCPKKHPVGRTVPGEPPLSYENANVGSAGTPRPTFRHAPGTDSTFNQRCPSRPQGPQRDEQSFGDVFLAFRAQDLLAVQFGHVEAVRRGAFAGGDLGQRN